MWQLQGNTQIWVGPLPEDLPPVTRAHLSAVPTSYLERGTILDLIAVERTVAGDPPAWLSRADRTEAVRRLNALGYSDPAVARLVGVTDRTVERIRNRNGIAAANRQEATA